MKKEQKINGIEGIGFESKIDNPDVYKEGGLCVEDGNLSVLYGGNADNGSRSIESISAEEKPSFIKTKNSDTNTLAKQYERVCDMYIDVFLELTDHVFSSWLEVGYMVDCDGDVFSFKDVKDVVDGKYTVNQLFDWREYCLRVHILRLPDISLEQFVKGKHKISNDTLDRLENLKRDFENEVERVKDELF